MRADTNSKMWALYADREMDYDLDRNPDKQPSIEEMTKKAIEKLSKNDKGFFLMVEGSKVDWAAHANDPVGMATDFLAFDRAVGAALEFAKQNGETTVIITSDHGNSGVSIGRESCKGYDKLTKDQLFKNLSQFKLTAEGFAKKVNTIPNSEKSGFHVQQFFIRLNVTDHYKPYLHGIHDTRTHRRRSIPGQLSSTGNSSDGYAYQHRAEPLYVQPVWL